MGLMGRFALEFLKNQIFLLTTCAKHVKYEHVLDKIWTNNKQDLGVKEMKTKFAFMFVVLALVLAACAPATPIAEPTVMPEPTAMPQPTATEAPVAKTIVDIATEDGRFTTLVAAVQAAGLVET